MVKTFCLLAVSFFSFVAWVPAQKLSVVVNYETSNGNADKNAIFYKPGQLLNWDDFIGTPLKGSDDAALTSAGFGLNLVFNRVDNNSQLVITVNCSFSKKNSWVMPGNKTAYILNHEQKHFDIAFIHTILFIQNLKKASFTNSNYNSLINKIYAETEKALTEEQDQYDAATSNSRIPKKQAEWDEKISGQLALAVKQL